MAASIQGAGRLRAPDAQGAGRSRDPRCPILLMERSLRVFSFRPRRRVGMELDASNGRPRDRGGEGDLVPRAARGPVSQGRRDSISSECLRGRTEVLVEDGCIDSGCRAVESPRCPGCRAVERPPMPSHADGAISLRVFGFDPGDLLGYPSGLSKIPPE